MNKTFKIGLIGGGVNSAVGATHFIAAQMDKRFKVEAGSFSRRKDINIQTAEQWKIKPEHLYDDLCDLLQQEKNNVDAIVILTPTPEHTYPVIQSLQLGYPVICEKALASSSAEAKFIKQTQMEQQGFLAVTYNYSGYPMLRELKSMINQGRLGVVEQIHIEMPQEGFARLNREGEPVIPQQWRLQDGEIPTISLDLGVHIHHIIDFLTGEKPCEVMALQSSRGHFRQVIDNTICIARYTNNLECNIWFSKAALGYRNGLRVRVFGELGSAEWYQMDPEFITYHDNRGRKSIIDRASIDVEITNNPRYNRFKAGHPSGFLEAFANLYWDIADSLGKFRETGVQSSEFVFGAQHSVEGLIMLEAMAQSSKEKCWKSMTI